MSRQSNSQVTILGGGITGFTTGVVLQALGMRVEIVTEHVPLQSQMSPPFPAVASDYAMASAYPHHLQVDNLERITDASQALFESMLSHNNSGVKRYRMFEVFEGEPPVAPQSSRRMNFRTFEGSPAQLMATLNPPVRPGAEHLRGWVFDTYFADMRVYLPYLWSMFRERGGNVRAASVTREFVSELGKESALVNCLGIGAPDIFEDTAPRVIMRGRQVMVPHAPMVVAGDGVPMAYNYTPDPQLYRRGDGAAEYVHFFPRSDGWLLGQTREPGTMGTDGRWTGTEVSGEHRWVGGESIPAAIIDLNAELLANWQDIELDQSALIGRTGYRYYRDPSGSGVRLCAEKRDGAVVVHNYGHGGSGVTVSWGCALESAAILADQINHSRSPEPKTDLDKLVLSLLPGCKSNV